MSGPPTPDLRPGSSANPPHEDRTPLSLEDVPQAACIINARGVIVATGSRLGLLMGCPAQHLVGARLGDLHSGPEDEDADTLTGESSRLVELRSVCADQAIIRVGPELRDRPGLRLVTITDLRHPSPDAYSYGRQLVAAHIDRTPLGVIEWSLDRSARYWNPAAERIFGYTAAEVLGADVFPFIVDEASRAHVDKVWKKLASRTGGESSVNTNITKDGRIIQCHWHNTPLLSPTGEVVGVASLVEDITHRVRAEREIAEARTRLERLVTKIPVIVWALDDDGKPVLWNECAEQVTGFGQAHIIGNPAAAEMLALSPQAGDYDSEERAVRCEDGSIRRIQWSNIAARCPIPGWSAWGIGIDVTDRHLASQAYRQSEQHFRDIIESVDLAGIVVDEQSRIRFVNDFFLRLTGAARDEIVGRPWGEVLGPGSHGPIPADSSSAFPLRAEGELQTPDGSTRTIVWARSLLRDAAGTIVGACSLGMDVTDHRRAQAELAAHRDRLEELVEQRTRDLEESQLRLRDAEHHAAIGRIASGLSHDLGNVLLPVRCRLDTLSGASLDERGRAAVAAVIQGMELLDHLAEGLRLLGGDDDAPWEAGQGGIERVYLNGWWNEVKPLLEGVVPDEVNFHVEAEQGLPAVDAPRHLLTRAVMNLLINAVEAVAREPGRPPAILMSVGVAPDENAVEITVSDSGPGIPPETRNRLIEPFFTTKTRGLSTGLGLSIVGAVATRSGGSFDINNGENGGAVARLRLRISATGDHDTR